ncbi:MAG: hypothetical protein CFE21_09430 [Bacteroidetes bacterium B1(2017)]|nr:MAG: hypothetical protein CFE21_09430 [Bacteroidetes bacterium B1(2017)]
MRQILILLSLLILGCSTQQSENNIDQKEISDIKKAFESWTKSEISKGNFFAMDSCNGDYYMRKDSLGLESVFGYAVPDDSSEINYYYANLNGDTKKDALITFTPYQCDGGNASMWVQYQVLVLSQGDSYLVDDSYFERFDTAPGLFQLDSVAPKAVFGTYFEFAEKDGRCCPSITKPIKIDLEKNEFTYSNR